MSAFVQGPRRMTIRTCGEQFQVFGMKREVTRVGTGYPADFGGWFVSRAARAQFTGTYSECSAFIQEQGAQFMSEHGISC